MSKIIKSQPPKLTIKTAEHFWVAGLKRAFDISGLIPLYVYVSQNLENISRNTDLEFNIGVSTIVYSVDNNNGINLITGWKGERKRSSSFNAKRESCSY